MRRISTLCFQNISGYNHSELTKSEYLRLHQEMRKKIPKPLVCQFCFKVPPFEIANLDSVYKDNKIHWFWCCRSCHLKYDYKNGLRKPYIRTTEILEKQNRNRVDNSGKNYGRVSINNPNYGKHLSIETKTKQSSAAVRRWERHRAEARALQPPGMQRCIKCKNVRSEDEFVMRKGKNGLYVTLGCKICDKRYNKRCNLRSRKLKQIFPRLETK